MIVGYLNAPKHPRKQRTNMAIDIEAIRKTLAKISSGDKGGGSKFNRWKYEKPGTYHLRVLPFRNADPGMPFPQRSVYFGISGNGKGMIVSPENAGNKDPIKEFRISLFNDAKNKPQDEANELKDMAKKLNSKTITCVAVVDRSNEGLGPQMWSPNWSDAQTLLGLFLTDAGDYTDLKEGFDLTLVVVEGKKRNQQTGKPILEAMITADRKSTPAAKDDATLKAWLEAMPNVDEYYPVTSTEETERKLKEWLDGPSPEGDDSEGTSRGGDPAKAESTPAAPAKQSVAEIAAAMSAAKPAAKKPAPAKKPLLQQAEDDLDKELADLESSDS
jgi:hypothetical protein